MIRGEVRRLYFWDVVLENVKTGERKCAVGVRLNPTSYTIGYAHGDTFEEAFMKAMEKVVLAYNPPGGKL